MIDAQQTGSIDSADLSAALADEPLDRSMDNTLYCTYSDVPNDPKS